MEKASNKQKARSRKFLKMAADCNRNKLNATQYELTTWAARSWMAYQCQKISIALQRAAASEISAEYARAGAVGAERGTG